MNFVKMQLQKFPKSETWGKMLRNFLGFDTTVILPCILHVNSEFCGNRLLTHVGGASQAPSPPMSSGSRRVDHALDYPWNHGATITLSTCKNPLLGNATTHK